MKKVKKIIISVLSIAILSVAFTGTVANAWRVYNTRNYQLNITTGVAFTYESKGAAVASVKVGWSQWGTARGWGSARATQSLYGEHPAYFQNSGS